VYYGKLLAGSLGLLLAFSSCSQKTPAAQHRLTGEQLAWKGYQPGEVLRFGHSQDNSVRTYRITAIMEQMVKQAMGPNLTPLPTKLAPECQELTVMAQRTDVPAQAQAVLVLGLYQDDQSREIAPRALAEWEASGSVRLPVNEVSQGIPFDPLQYPATELLPTATFGPTTYSQVIHVTTSYQGTPAPGIRLTRQLYYAKDKGVVAYEEEGTGLWYRLP
jgi:hypothetical protein